MNWNDHSGQSETAGDCPTVRVDTKGSGLGKTRCRVSNNASYACIGCVVGTSKLARTSASAMAFPASFSAVLHAVGSSPAAPRPRLGSFLFSKNNLSHFMTRPPHPTHIFMIDAAEMPVRPRRVCPIWHAAGRSRVGFENGGLVLWADPHSSFQME